jgi:hypothetical protein
MDAFNVTVEWTFQVFNDFISILPTLFDCHRCYLIELQLLIE